MRIYFARHGESEANVLREYSNRGLSHGLTAEGRRQAHSLGQSLKSAGIRRIYCSPLLRARETADIVSAQLGMGYEATDALREFDCGIIEGRSDDASHALYAATVEEWLRDGRWEQRIEEGESLLDQRDRFVPFLDQLVAEHSEHDGTLCLISHGGLYRCMLPLVLSNVSFEFARTAWIDHTSFVAAEWTLTAFAMSTRRPVCAAQRLVDYSS